MTHIVEHKGKFIKRGGPGMSSCRVCQSVAQREFPAEINVHFPGIKNLTELTVWLFPRLLVCLHCGFTEFQVEEKHLQKLRDVQGSQCSEKTEEPYALAVLVA